MERGDIVTVQIEDMSSEGQGIGRADGLVIFVPHTVVGDVAEVRLTKVKKRFAFSHLKEILKPSEYRTDIEPCSGMAEGCGGCSFFPMEYGLQLEVKEKQIREKLRRLGRSKSRLWNRSSAWSRRITMGWDVSVIATRRDFR